MKWHEIVFALTMVIVLTSGCATTPVDLTAPIHQKDILYLEAFGDVIDSKAPILVIYLPGDTGNNYGHDNRYFFTEAKYIASKNANVIGVSILRPGTFDTIGNRSPGYQGKSDDNKTKKNINSTVRTIAHLKNTYKPERIIAVGHSGGAMMLGVIIGQYPDLLDSVVLTSTVCDIPAYRMHRRGVNRWTNSQSPEKYVDGISSDIVIRLVTGMKDTNTIPKFAKDCEVLYAEQGLDVNLELVPGATHKFGSLRIAVRSSVESLL